MTIYRLGTEGAMLGTVLDRDRGLNRMGSRVNHYLRHTPES
jgi:hypothetical protein